MFKVASMPTFKRQVKILVPSDTGHDEQSLTATYKAIPVDEAEKFNLSTGSGSADFLRAVIVRLDDLVDDNKQPIEYTEQVREDVLSRSFARIPLARTYLDAVAGAKTGN